MTRKETNLTYSEFKAEMGDLLKRVFSYTPDQIGFDENTRKMSDLADDYPEFDIQLENE